MTRRITRKNNKRPRIKRKVILLTFLIIVLLAVSTAPYTSHQYEVARKESQKLLEENGQQEVEEIKFNSETTEEEYVHILLVGVDNKGDGPARTDTILVAQYQPSNGKAKLLSLMRDSYVSIPGYKNNKINQAFFLGGAELLRQTIKENFDIDIHYYALVDFNGFVRVVDVISPNGIEVDIERRMYYEDRYANLTINFQPGLQHLDGQQTLNYVRYRNDSESDFGRVKRQQEVLSILKDEILSFSGVKKLPKLLGSIEPFVSTNIANSQILDYGKSFFLNPIGQVETLTIPFEGSYVNSRYNHAGAVLELDMEKNKKAIQEFLELNEQ